MPAMAQRTAAQVRAIYLDHGGRGPEYAVIECAHPDRCNRATTIRDSAGLSNEQLRETFLARGWWVGPIGQPGNVRCPEHREQS